MTSIEGSRWKHFADHFSAAHDGWSASLQLRQADGGEEVVVDDRPFRGVTLEDHQGHEALILSFGDDPDEHLAHIVEHPRELSVLEDRPEQCSLLIGQADGTGCILELSSPFSPD